MVLVEMLAIRVPNGHFAVIRAVLSMVGFVEMGAEGTSIRGCGSGRTVGYRGWR